ncbi:hypothetical protein GE061_013536 [Apolygus lucorum]|uniref:Uncharacterized protein n=1 Tax=Apolygus lucorum TaxID=248454 RepID=A0A6A4K0N0_APOLU|nr:hypothetical protein GE061_013536 [Apolygus lucorum]
MTKGDLEKSPDSNTSSEVSEKVHRSRPSEVSDKARRSKAHSEAGKLHAESTTYPTLSSKPSSDEHAIHLNCGCPNKREAFFDKLLSYLEKQSEVISRCCFDEKTVPKRNKRLNTDPIFNKTDSPCLEHDSPNSSKEHKLEEKHSILKTRDNECKIIVEVCTCDKDKDVAPIPSESRKSVKLQDQTHSEVKKHHQPNETNNEIDCSGCEQKVADFFKLADEICQAYLKRCLMNDDVKLHSSYSDRNVKIEELDKPQEQRGQEHPIQEKVQNRDGRGCNSLAVQVECNGDREEFVIHPCDCPPKSGRAPSHHQSGRTSNFQPRTGQDDLDVNQRPKRSCVEVFEDRYGQILRDLHSKLVKPGPQSGAENGNQPPPPPPPPPPGGQQQSTHPNQQYPTSDYPTYPPPQQQHPPQQPGYQPPPARLPPNEQRQPYKSQNQQPYPPQHQPYPHQYQPYPPHNPVYQNHQPSPDSKEQEKNRKASRAPPPDRRKKKSSS